MGVARRRSGGTNSRRALTSPLRASDRRSAAHSSSSRRASMREARGVVGARDRVDVAGQQPREDQRAARRDARRKLGRQRHQHGGLDVGQHQVVRRAGTSARLPTRAVDGRDAVAAPGSRRWSRPPPDRRPAPARAPPATAAPPRSTGSRSRTRDRRSARPARAASSSAIAITSRVDAWPPGPEGAPRIDVDDPIARPPRGGASQLGPDDEAAPDAQRPEVLLPDVAPLVLVRLAARDRDRIGRHARRAQARAGRLDLARRPRPRSRARTARGSATVRPRPGGWSRCRGSRPRRSARRRRRPALRPRRDGTAIASSIQRCDTGGVRLRPDAALRVSARCGASLRDGDACAPRASCACASRTASRSNAAA